MAHAPTTRPKVAIGGDEEATATLSLGEFTHVPSLSNSEARVLINAVLDQRRRKDPNRAAAIQETETLVKTQDYLDTFARFKAPQNIEQVERLLRDVDGLESFERSQLGAFLTPRYIRYPWRRDRKTDVIFQERSVASLLKRQRR